MIDRKKGPKITTEFDLSLKGVKQSKLENGLELYEVNSGTQNIIKVEIVFRTGRIHETHRASANAALSLIREGSTRHSAQELAYQYDFYGAAVKASCNMEYASVSLVVLERYFSQIWPTWLHMVLYPQFDKKEVEKYSAVKTQKLVNQLAKNNVQSYRRLTEHIFGSEHPYGYNTEPSDIAGLQREMVLDYFNNNLGFDNAYILMSGRYTEATRAKIVNDIGSIKRKNNHPETVFERANITPSKIYVQTENDIQTSIKLGRTLFPRTKLWGFQPSE